MIDMQEEKQMSNNRKRLTLILVCVLLLSILSGCASNKTSGKTDPKNPTTISVWHYYNGAVMNAFDRLVKEFNETVGTEQGIIVEGHGMGSVGDLQTAVMSSANKEVGSQPMPDIFASYADTALAAEKLGILADLGQYFTEEELAAYIPSYLTEGRIGEKGELRIFPIAKSTEIFMLNETDWQPFATATGSSHADLATVEGLARVAKAYYEWTDAQTPDVANDGKAFYGRDAIANMFIIGAKQLGEELFKVENGKVIITANKDTIRRIWDAYYVPFVSGHFTAIGRYRSDDAKVGSLLSYVGSTSSAMYFPLEVTLDGATHPIEATILPAPVFEGGAPVLVQQGAGMVVTKGTPASEYASATFLKWFTDTDTNIQFSALSGYMPVKTEANNYDHFISVISENNIEQDDISKITLKTAFEDINRSEMYTSQAFDGGSAARDILNYSLADKAVADREAVLALLAGGASQEEALSGFLNDTNFEAWFAEFDAKLQETIAGQ